MKGFSLAEILVVSSVVAIVGLILTEIFLSSIGGSNKAQVIANLKRNGQVVLETMDKNIRNAKEVICPLSPVDGIVKSNKIIIRVGESSFVRYSFTAPVVLGKSNGTISVDNPSSPPSEKAELAGYCLADPTGAAYLTDSNAKSGVSISVDPDKSFITRDSREGYLDVITIEFNVAPAIDAPPSYTGAVDPEKFITTIQLR